MNVESDADRPVDDAARVESERENCSYDTSVLSVVVHDEYDARAYTETLQLSSRMPGAIARAEQRFRTAGALVEDIFCSVYQPAPTLRSASDVPLSATVNRTILEQLLGTAEWDSLRRAGTIGDQFASALAAAAVGPAWPLDQATLDRLDQLHEAEIAAEHLFAEAKALDDLAAARGDSGSDLYVRARAARQHATARQREAVELAGQIETDVEAIEDATRRAGRTSLRAAEEEIEVMLTAIKTCTGGYAPGVDAGAGSSAVTLLDKLTLATRLGQSNRLKQVAELCGRLTRIALQVQRSKVQHPPDEIVGITIGGDLSRMLPVELGLLSDPALEDAWHLKYLDKRLMELEMIGSERQGRGPIIVALDSSASMSDQLGSRVTKEAWSKALRSRYWRSPASSAATWRSSTSQGPVSSTDSSSAGGQATPSELIATTEWFYAGGTVYDEWMAETLRLVDASRFDRADVVCLSDGEVSVSPALEGEWNRRRLARGMRCYGVLLGDDTGATALARVCDALVTLADLTDDERVDAVAERVLGAAMRLGYRPKVHDRLQVALCEALLENHSPRLEDLTPERFDGLRRDRNPRDVRGWFVLGQTLFGLGLFPQPPRTLQRGTIWQGASDEDRVAGEWLDWCIRWRSTSTSSPRTRRSYHRTLCLAGRWLAETHPEVSTPEQWTRALAAEYVAALDRATVGQWGNTFALDPASIGKPIAARTKEVRLTAVRVFFRDLQEWGWIPRRFDPRRDLGTPRAVRRLIGPDPWVIADDVWAKLLWAGLHLNPDDLRVPRSGIVAAYSLTMIRALAAVWFFAGLRRNEIRRLRVGCIRWQRDDVVVAGTDEVLPKDAVCLLQVPVQKTGLAFTKPVDRVVGEAITAWERERPDQPALLDRKTTELVQILFACRGRPIGEGFLNTCGGAKVGRDDCAPWAA